MVLLFDFEKEEDKVLLEMVKKSLESTFLRTEIVRSENINSRCMDVVKEFFLKREYYFLKREEIKALIELDKIFSYIQSENLKGVKKIYLVDGSYTRFIRRIATEEKISDLKTIYRDLSNLFMVYTKAVIFSETGLSTIIDHSDKIKSKFNLPFVNFYVESSHMLSNQSEAIRRISEVTNYPKFIRDFIMKFVYGFRANCRNSFVKGPTYVFNKNFQEDLVDRIRLRIIENFEELVEMKDFYFREGKNIKYTTF